MKHVHLLAALTMAACSSGASPGAPPPGGNGVDDVRQACDLRARWTRATVRDCSNCVFVSPAEACTCDPTPERGRCFSQQAAFAREPDCTLDVAGCAQMCAPTDCACIDACYAPHPPCRKAKSAVDGCVAQVCAPLCR